MAMPGKRRPGRPKKVTVQEPDPADFPKKKKRKRKPGELSEEQLAEVKARKEREKAQPPATVAKAWDDNLEYVYAAFRSLLFDWDAIHNEQNWKSLEKEEQEWYAHWSMALTVLEDRRRSSGWASEEEPKSLEDYPQPEPLERR